VPSPPAVAVLLKRVDLRPAIDPLTGALTPDAHGGLSAADECALELALRQAERAATSVLAVSAGGPAADAVLRQAIEAGAGRAVRVDVVAGAESATVAAVLAAEVRGCSWVWCGAHSLDRGSGSVPAFVAGHLGFAQALGVASVQADPSGSLVVERRLDGGRREVLRVRAPAVVSVEAGVAPLRRAALASAIAANAAPIERRQASVAEPLPARRRGYRPRARVLPGPDPALSARERAAALAGVDSVRRTARVVRAGSEEAVDELLSFLSARGYLDEDGAPT
jgi:electron transfer flavoprotein beta subunit